jgi:hypothetical protein
MLAAVRLLFEDGGRPLALHRLSMPPHLHVGHLELRECHLEQCRRQSHRATLIAPGDGLSEHLVPPLYDAVVRYISNGELTISGMEIDDLTRKMTAQSWRVKFVQSETCEG